MNFEFHPSEANDYSQAGHTRAQKPVRLQKSFIDRDDQVFKIIPNAIVCSESILLQFDRSFFSVVFYIIDREFIHIISINHSIR